MKVNSLFALLVLGVVGYVYAVPAKNVFHVPPEMSEKIIESTLKCISKMGFDTALMNQLKEGKYAEDDKVIEALLCMTQDLGIGFPNGKIKIDKVMNEMFPTRPEARAVMEKCNKDYSNVPGENFKKFLVCFRDNAPFKVML